jgi:hypothetical protein
MPLNDTCIQRGVSPAGQSSLSYGQKPICGSSGTFVPISAYIVILDIKNQDKKPKTKENSEKIAKNLPKMIKMAQDL